MRIENNINEIFIHNLKRIQHIQDSFSENEELDLEKPFPEGTIRTHGGVKVKKEGKKWIPVGEKKKKKEVNSAIDIGNRKFRLSYNDDEKGKFQDAKFSDGKGTTYNAKPSESKNDFIKRAHKQIKEDFRSEGKESGIKKEEKINFDKNTNLISLYGELKKDSVKYKKVIDYLDNIGKDWNKVSKIKVAYLIKESEKENKIEKAFDILGIDYIEKGKRRKGEPKDNEERAQTHFKISNEDWGKLDEKKKKEYISKLPKRGTKLEEEKIEKSS